MASAINAKVTARIMAQHRHLDVQIENLERKMNETADTITDLKNYKQKITNRLNAMSLREERQSKKEQQLRYGNSQQLELFT